MMKKRRVAGLIAIATIVLFIVADIFFALDLPRQSILFIGWCFFSHPRKQWFAAFIL